MSGREPSDAIRPDRARVVIEAVTPQIDGGRYPAKRVAGEPVAVGADVFADGHDELRVLLRHRPVGRAAWTETPMRALGNDRWTATFVPAEPGMAEYCVTAWVDRFESWRHEVQVKFEAGQPLDSELLEGAALVAGAAAAAGRARAGSAADRRQARQRLLRRAEQLTGSDPPAARVAAALAPDLTADMARWLPPADPVTSAILTVRVERLRAGFAAWYEMFPRSETPDPSRGATFDEAAGRLDDIAAMGFDVVYLPPIHPIGRTARKGPNNQPSILPADPGSPWAIGSEEGGHTAVHPDLGTLADFRRFVARAESLGMDVALDIAFQCSPDHPWVREHPEWFRHRPDGTIKYAENPPKQYQDIYPLDFETGAWRQLWDALRDVFLFWIDQGVRIFRVDNPHTKPFRFWAWAIAAIQREHPDVVFLSEAFTRPKPMRHLAKIGFTQSYTYFTWRNTKAELTEYFTELTQTEVREYLRPNLFANTPDILHAYLQAGGRPAFEVRLILAATLSPLYGIYSGFELAENVPLRPGSEEYLHSEKYEVRPRDWSRADSLRPLISRLNTIRRTHAAFLPGSRLTFHPTDNDALLCYSRESADGADRLLVVVNLDPQHMQHGWADVPGDGWPAGAGPYLVHDELDDLVYHWQRGRNYVRLEPGRRAAHVLRLPALPSGDAA
jgi:starch synthase (maltosyl-transferring)